MQQTQGRGNPPGPPRQGLHPRYPHHLSSTGNQVRRSDYPTGPRQDQPEKAGWPGTTPDTQEDPPRQSQEVVIHTPTHQQAPCATQKICDAQMHQEHPEALQTRTLHSHSRAPTSTTGTPSPSGTSPGRRQSHWTESQILVEMSTAAQERPMSVSLVKHRAHWRPGGIQPCRRIRRRL